MKKIIWAVIAAAGLSNCALVYKVHQEDLDAWIGVPVEYLDMHPIFISMNLTKSISANGVEIRNYRNGGIHTSCRMVGQVATPHYISNSAGTFYSGTTYSGGTPDCSSEEIVCNNIFYVKDGKVLQYLPTGRCYTDSRLRPIIR